MDLLSTHLSDLCVSEDTSNDKSFFESHGSSREITARDEGHLIINRRKSRLPAVKVSVSMES